MRMTFGPDDDREFHAAKTALLARFETWLTGDHRLASPDEAGATAGDAGLALDWKWGYAGGDLGRWTTADIGEFLLEWCPRKLSVPPEDSATIPPALAAFMAFLNDTGLLSPGSSPAGDLIGETVDLSGAFIDAMGDPSNFGMAKSLFASAAADGIDLEDPDQLRAFMEEFNARPEEERRRIIPDTAFAAPRKPTLPPVVPPDDAEVAASRAAAPILTKFAALATFTAAGRKLTQKGNLTLADARALVELLDTGDVMDPNYGSRTFRTTSAAELVRLNQIFKWAKKAGVVRVAHGRVHATKKGLAIAKDPAAFFDKAVDGLLAAGSLASQRDPDRWMAWPEVTDLLDRLTVALLVGPYVGRRPFPIDELCEQGTDAVLSAFHFRGTTDEEVARRVTYDVTDLVDALELAGMVRRIDAAAPEDDDVFRRQRVGGTVELTAAGVVTARRLLIEAGYEASATGRFTDATATELFLGTDGDDFAVLAAELEAWRRRRPPTQQAAELAAAVRALADPALTNLALAVMGEIDLDIAGPEVRALTTDPATRGFALCWLVDHGLESPDALFDPDDLPPFVDVLAQRLVTKGPDGLCDTLALAGDHEHQVALLGGLWRSPSPATEVVLAAIGEVHRVKVVAKAARKALFKRRSWSGP